MGRASRRGVPMPARLVEERCREDVEGHATLRERGKVPSQG